jgi:hypothetical protein
MSGFYNTTYTERTIHTSGGVEKERSRERGRRKIESYWYWTFLGHLWAVFYH